MTDFTKISVQGCVLPLGTLSDEPPHGSDFQRVRVSAKEMRIRIHDLRSLPITMSPCMSEHAPIIVGSAEVLWIKDNELLFGGYLFSGLLPTGFDASVMGFSPEFDEIGMIHYNWIKNFKLNALALVLRDRAAFRNTRLEICMGRMQ